MSITLSSASLKFLFVLVFLSLTMIFTGNIHAAAYLKLGDIKGEATSKDHKNWINLESVALPATLSTAVSTAPDGTKTNVSSAGGEAATRYSSKRQHKPLSITKPADTSSASLQKAAESGRVFKKATLDAPDPDDPAQTVRYELENVQITSYQVSGSAGGDSVPMDSFSLNFEQIKVIKPPRAKD